MIRGRALLQQAYAELNRRVEERTADLSEANEQLQKEVGDRIRAEQELRAAHDELIQASKLAALGQMAAGITHELNQPLAALRSFSDNTRVLLDRGEQAAARENLEAIAALTERMGKITNQLKLFVGRAKPRNEQALVVRALRSVLSLLDERLRGVALTLTLQDATVSPAQDAPLDLARDYPGFVARCEDLRLEQVLINLLGNALDAVAGVAAPAIEVTIVVSAATLAVEVRDNGSGIAPDLLPRLFEPFFTTKEMGRGRPRPRDLVVDRERRGRSADRAQRAVGRCAVRLDAAARPHASSGLRVRAGGAALGAPRRPPDRRTIGINDAARAAAARPVRSK